MKITNTEIFNICKSIGEKSFHLSKNSSFNAPGLFAGKSGILLFLNQLYHLTKDQNIKDKALLILEDIIEDIQSKEINFGLSEGIAGITLTLDYIFNVFSDIMRGALINEFGMENIQLFPLEGINK